MTFRRLEPSKKDPALEDIPLLERPELDIYDTIYSLEDNTMIRPQGNMQVILKYDVEGKRINREIIRHKTIRSIVTLCSVLTM